jgi:hypothetical protein
MESLEKLDSRISAREAKLEKMKQVRDEKKRKRETQMLCIKGRLLDKMIELGTIDRRTYEQSLDKFLTRDYDRRIFGFLEKPGLDQPAKKKQPATQDTRPIQVQPQQAPTQKTPVAPTVYSGRKLAEVGVDPKDFLQ